MSHKKTAKALAMLVLANDELLGQIVELQDEVHDAHEQILNVKGQALESMELLQDRLDRAKANLDAMQRDRNSLAAEVRTLKEENACQERELEDFTTEMQARAKDYRRVKAERGAALRERDAVEACRQAWEAKAKALKEEVRELRLVIKGQWGRIGELGGKVPPMDVPHAGPWMAAAEVAGQGGEE